jgi:hypothetical protein
MMLYRSSKQVVMGNIMLPSLIVVLFVTLGGFCRFPPLFFFLWLLFSSVSSLCHVNSASITPPASMSPVLRSTPQPTATSPLSTASTPSPQRSWNKLSNQPTTFSLAAVIPPRSPGLNGIVKDINVASPPPLARPFARGKPKTKSSSRSLLYPKEPESTPEQSYVTRCSCRNYYLLCCSLALFCYFMYSYDPYLDNSRDGLSLMLKGASVSTANTNNGPVLSSSHPTLNVLPTPVTMPASTPASSAKPSTPQSNIWQVRAASSGALLSPQLLERKNSATTPLSLPFPFGVTLAEPTVATNAVAAPAPTDTFSSSSTLGVPSNTDVQASPSKSPKKRSREESSTSTTTSSVGFTSPKSNRTLFVTPVSPPTTGQWNRSSSLLAVLGKDAASPVASPSFRDQSPARKKSRNRKS